VYAYVLKRLLYIIPTVLLISIIAFVAIELPPGDFLNQKLQDMIRQQGAAKAREMVEVLRMRYGLERPAYQRYLFWMKEIILHGNFGYSYVTNRTVNEIIKSRILLTMLISLMTLLFTWIVAIPIGVYSATKQYTIFDYIFTFIAFIGRAVPNFLLALILMFLVYENFGWGVGGLFSTEYKHAAWSLAKLLDLGKHLILPIIVIGTAGTAGLVRILRGMVLDELNKEYTQTARAKGLSERIVVWKHIFKIAILPIVSTIGWLLPAIISGATITSIVLNLPTTGAAMLNALKNQDMYVAGSFILILSTLTIIGTLISDILLIWIDPRIKYE